MSELKSSVLIIRKKMLFTPLAKIYTATGSDGKNEYHLCKWCTRIINYNYEDIWGVEAKFVRSSKHGHHPHQVDQLSPLQHLRSWSTSCSPHEPLPPTGRRGWATNSNPGKPSSLKTIIQRKRKKEVPLVLPENHPPCEPSPQVKINTYVKEI